MKQQRLSANCYKSSLTYDGSTMHSISKKLCLFFLFILAPAVSLARSKFNLPEGVTPVSHEIYHLHMVIFYICCLIGVIVFGVLIYSLIKYRKSKGAVAQDFHEHLGIEIAWAVIPFFILVGMAIPATKVVLKMHDTADPALTVKITGYQWKWQYEYLDQGIKFFSTLSTPEDQIHNKAPKSQWYLLEVDKPLVVPIHEKIRFLMTANDVIHSWWVPDLGIKKDAIPGYINDAWAVIEKPGIYRGQCAELCGQHHGYMPIEVHAVTRPEFDTWVAEHQAQHANMKAAANKTYSLDELMTQGKTAYETSCAVCHKSDGSGMPPAFPGLKNSKVAVGPVAKHIDIVLHGVTGTAMQAFANQLDDLTLAAIITYERNAWGNNTSPDKDKIVQPSDIVKERNG